MEDPLDCVFVVCSGKDLLNNELAAAGDDDGVVAEVGVLEEDAAVLLVDANGVLDGAHAAVAGGELGVEVVDLALAIAAQRETVRHVSGAVLAEVKGVLTLVRVLRVSVGDDHFREGQTVKDGADVALVVVGDIAEDDALAVVEANVEVPVLPGDLAALHLEGDALGLSDVDGLEVGAVAAGLLLYGGRGVVYGGGLAEGPADGGDVDGDDGLLVGVVDGAEVEGVLVLAGVRVRAVVHEGLLEADGVAVALIVADRPGVAVDLVHVGFGDAGDFALLNDFGVGAADVFDDLELFHCDLWLWC